MLYRCVSIFFILIALPGCSASVVSHEIGHNPGLGHLVELENLMGSGSGGQRLNAGQITTALASNFSVAVVPVPPALLLFLSGLGVLGFYKRKRV